MAYQCINDHSMKLAPVACSNETTAMVNNPEKTSRMEDVLRSAQLVKTDRPSVQASKIAAVIWDVRGATLFWSGLSCGEGRES
ncbi:hypothetical protein KIN20_032350 [Parelaphostrongylus tenuis]|uniref:Uncharacterized protein n=1 Tax=Parelaphostrongylus tenuis TaxID=148309 RepID=A0AAD5R8P4_PARTN|nr:hypothetical protein KIN20_032350 [Parelaphostrongylus tenuis]